MPSETDPLLPDNEPAPEIVGYGYSRHQKAGSQTQFQYQHPSHLVETTEEDDGKESETRSATDNSPLRTIFAIFSVVVCFGLFLSLLLNGESGKSAKAPRIAPSKPSKSVASRVEKILSENPLIGRPFFNLV